MQGKTGPEVGRHIKVYLFIYFSTAKLFSPWATRKDTPCDFRWPESSVYALGIHFPNDISKCESLNFDKKLEDLEKILNFWKRRKLTLLGIINMVKSLGLSKLIYNASVLSLPGNFSKRVDKTILDFIWENKPHKIKTNINWRQECGWIKNE